MQTVFDCKDCFEQGIKKRSKIEMSLGAGFKLREALEGIERYSNTLKNIGVDALHIRQSINFGCCTSEDLPFWLYDLPDDICFDLGYYVVGTFHALTYDGLTSFDIKKLNQYQRKKIPIILDLAEVAKQDIYNQWSECLKSFAFRQGPMFCLIDEAEELIRHALSQVNSNDRLYCNSHCS